MIDINVEPGCGLVVHKRLVVKDITKDGAVIEYIHSIAIGAERKAERKKDKFLTEFEVEWYVNITLNSPEQAEDIGKAFMAAAEEMRKEEKKKKK